MTDFLKKSKSFVSSADKKSVEIHARVPEISRAQPFWEKRETYGH